MRTNRVLAVAFSGVLFAALVNTTAPAEAVDCYPPGSCNTTQTQTYSAVPGTDIAVASATAALCAGGVCVPVTVTKTVSAGELTLSISNGSTVRIKPISTGGTPTQVSADGTMIIPASGGVTITLTGLQPGSWVDVYLNSDRIFLGKAKVGAAAACRRFHRRTHRTGHRHRSRRQGHLRCSRSHHRQAGAHRVPERTSAG